METTTLGFRVKGIGNTPQYSRIYTKDPLNPPTLIPAFEPPDSHG